MSLPALLLGQATPGPSAVPSPGPTITLDPPESVGEATNLIWESVQALWEGFVANIPLILVGIVLLGIGLWVMRPIGRAARSGIQRAGGDTVVSNLVERLTRIMVVVAFALLALSVAGVSVSAVLAGLGIAGLAVAFALQGIIENFVSGLIIILRKPFRAGDEILIEERQGVVTDIDLRTTRIRTYDGELVIIPNNTVFQATLVNLTHSGVIRGVAEFGVDYRDDHDAVAGVVEAAVAGIEGVLASPAPSVVCTGLGDSSVDFAVRFWTRADRSSVVRTLDQVLRSTKTALEDAGFSIPWPIRTLVMDDLDDNVVEVRRLDRG